MLGVTFPGGCRTTDLVTPEMRRSSAFPISREESRATLVRFLKGPFCLRTKRQEIRDMQRSGTALNLCFSRFSRRVKHVLPTVNVEPRTGFREQATGLQEPNHGASGTQTSGHWERSDGTLGTRKIRDSCRLNESHLRWPGLTLYGFS